MSATAFFDAARKHKRELTGNALDALTQQDVDEITRVLARWKAQGEAKAPSAGPKGLGDAQAFYKAVRGAFGALNQKQVDGFGKLLQAMGGAGWPVSWVAYALATTWHETGRAMQPNVESLNYSVDGLLKTFGRHRISAADAKAFGRAPGRPANQQAIGNAIYGGTWGKANLGNTQPGDGFRYLGRGYVQITGRANYAKAAAKTGYPLVSDPNLALRPDIAATILVWGMSEGAFTRKALKDYLPSPTGTRQQFTQARQIINALDKAGPIADLALKFQSALQAGRWA